MNSRQKLLKIMKNIKNKNKTMKLIIIGLSLVMLFCSSYAKQFQQDSLSVFVDPDTISDADENSVIRITIENKQYDTLVFISDVFVEGLTGQSVIFRAPLGEYAPNLLFLLPENNVIEYGTGKFLVNYNFFPKFFLIPPGNRKIIIVNLYPFKDIILNKSFTTGALLRFALKSTLDETVNEFYSQKSNDYKKSLINSDTLIANCNLSDSVTYYMKVTEKKGILNKIEDAFNIEVRSN